MKARVLGYGDAVGGGEWVFFETGGRVYRAPADADLDTEGLPMGRRWECSLEAFESYRDAVFGWVRDERKGAQAG